MTLRCSKSSRYCSKNNAYACMRSGDFFNFESLRYVHLFSFWLVIKDVHGNARDLIFHTNLHASTLHCMQYVCVCVHGSNHVDSRTQKNMRTQRIWLGMRSVYSGIAKGCTEFWCSHPLVYCLIDAWLPMKAWSAYASLPAARGSVEAIHGESKLVARLGPAILTSEMHTQAYTQGENHDMLCRRKSPLRAYTHLIITAKTSWYIYIYIYINIYIYIYIYIDRLHVS